MRLVGDDKIIDFDGVDQYDSLFRNEVKNPRKIVVNEIDYAVEDRGTLRGAFQIEGGWKYVLRPINPYGFVEQLYNVNDDPSESQGLKNEYPDIFASMRTQFFVSVSFLSRLEKTSAIYEISLGSGQRFGVE